MEGWDTQWEILEQAWIMGTCGLEFRCSVTWSVTYILNLCLALILGSGWAGNPLLHLWTSGGLQQQQEQSSPWGLPVGRPLRLPEAPLYCEPLLLLTCLHLLLHPHPGLLCQAHSFSLTLLLLPPSLLSGRSGLLLSP